MDLYHALYLNNSLTWNPKARNGSNKKTKNKQCTVLYTRNQWEIIHNLYFPGQHVMIHNLFLQGICLFLFLLLFMGAARVLATDFWPVCTKRLAI